MWGFEISGALGRLPDRPAGLRPEGGCWEGRHLVIPARARSRQIDLLVDQFSAQIPTRAVSRRIDSFDQICLNKIQTSGSLS